MIFDDSLPSSIDGPMSPRSIGSNCHTVTPSEVSRHIVQFYESEAFLAKAVGGFIGPALVAGNTGILIATREHLDAYEAELSDRGLDVSAVKARGRLITLDAAETLAAFMRDGEPDSHLFHSVVGSVIAGAGSEERVPYAFGEMVALLVAEGNGAGALKLESLWNDLADRHRLVLLCAYPIAQFASSSSSELFQHVCAVHSDVAPTESLSSEESKTDRSRSLALLQQRALALELEIADRVRAERALQEQSRTLLILQRVSTALVVEKDLDSIVQLVTDACCELTGAAFGAFFRTGEGSEEGHYCLSKLSGAREEAFSKIPHSRTTSLFRPTFDGESVVRISDVTADPRCGEDAPYFGVPSDHLPVKSYLAVPVVSNSGAVLGGLFLGSPLPDVFTAEAEQMAVAVAAQAAIAIENSKLNAALCREIEALILAQEASQRLAAIVESSDDAIVSKTLEGTIQTWNSGAQRIFGYAPDEVIGKHITILFPPEHLDEESAIISRIRRGERIAHYETKRMRKDGGILDISLTVSPVRNNEGKVVGASKIARDITQRKRDEAALAKATAELARSRDELERRVEERTASLREAVAQMEEFSYTVSHDLRAPLRAMNVYCNALAEDFASLLETEPEAMRCVRKIGENSARLDRMVRDILTYGRVARDELKLEPISLDELVRDTIYHYQVLQPPRAMLHVAPLGEVIGHEPSLMQVISNLLTNAVKFVQPGVTPEVCVRTENRDGRVRLWVEDNGIGIDPQYQHRLFGMFERLHPKLPYEGTGVGLAIVRKATERMGGSVGVESDGCTGSRFWVEFEGVSRLR